MAFPMPSLDEMQSRLDEWARRYFVAGASLGIMQDDEVRVAATGIINLDTGVEATPDSLFQIGSIGKGYTATLVMQLVDEGLVDLDAPITSVIGTRFADDEATATVTPRHLLTHSSGLDGDFHKDFGRGDDCVARYAEACRDLPSVARPGEAWSYSNSGFILLGRLVEILTGQCWDDALRTRVLEPAGLTDTVSLAQDALRHRTAVGHYVDTDLRVATAPGWTLPRTAGPCGATIMATAADLAGFGRLHLDEGRTRSGRQVVSHGSSRSMREPWIVMPVDPGLDSPNRYGFGMGIFDWPDRNVFGHDGDTIGQSAMLRAHPESGVVVAMLSNTATTAIPLRRRITRWVFGEFLGIDLPAPPAPPDVPVSIDLEPYVGTYERLGVRTEITLQDGHLVMSSHATGDFADVLQAQPPTTLIAVSPGRFLSHEPHMHLYFPLTSGGFEDGRPAWMQTVRLTPRRE